MATTPYSQTSPYASTKQTNWYMDLWSPRDIQASTSDQTITTTTRHTHRPDLLSYDLYGTVAFWWVFVMLNPDVLTDPIWDLRTDLQLRVPTRESLSIQINA